MAIMNKYLVPSFFFFLIGFYYTKYHPIWCPYMIEHWITLTPDYLNILGWHFLRENVSLKYHFLLTYLTCNDIYARAIIHRYLFSNFRTNELTEDIGNLSFIATTGFKWNFLTAPQCGWHCFKPHVAMDVKAAESACKNR